jgi:hypothetical protein
MRNTLNRIFKPVIWLLAAVYLLVDAIFLPVARLISGWLAQHWVFDRLRCWIVSLRPYPTLFLFAVPLIVLEPLRPVALYLMATGHVAGGIVIFVVGEVLKLVLVERLYCISHTKLMTIPAFAWSYGKYSYARDWVMSSEAWQTISRWRRISQCLIRRSIREWRASQSPRRLSSQSR